MFLKLLKSKLHLARVTDTKLNYAGSIAIDPDLFEAVGILPWEAVTVANLNNGNRFETYVVPAARGSREIVIMGAAAKLAAQGDTVIIMNYAYMTPDETKNFKPKVAVLDKDNQIEKMY